jgi:hypothetical protein
MVVLVVVGRRQLGNGLLADMAAVVKFVPLLFVQLPAATVGFPGGLGAQPAFGVRVRILCRSSLAATPKREITTSAKSPAVSMMLPPAEQLAPPRGLLHFFPMF